MALTQFKPATELAYGATEKNPQINATITIGTEDGSNGIATTIQLYDWESTLAQSTVVEMWLSATAGGVVSAVTSEAFGTGTELQEIVDHGHYRVISDATGKIVATWTIAGAATRYLNVILPGSGKVVSSSLITWAA